MTLAKNLSGPGLFHAVPDPEVVYRLSLSHGADVVAERWGAFSLTTISEWISIGRLRATGGKRKYARRSAEEQQRIIDAVFQHGSPAAAARALGMDRTVVWQVVVRAGVTDYPRTDPRKNGRRARLAMPTNPQSYEPPVHNFVFGFLLCHFTGFCLTHGRASPIQLSLGGLFGAVAFLLARGRPEAPRA